MAKRSVKRRMNQGEFNTDHYRDEESKVRALFPDHVRYDPDQADRIAEKNRDQRYTKNIKPRSKGQGDRPPASHARAAAIASLISDAEGPSASVPDARKTWSLARAEHRARRGAPGAAGARTAS